MNIDTVLFDLDGTLIDTNELIYASFDYTFKKYGYHFTKEEILTFNGPPLVETFYKVDEHRTKEMIETYREHNLLHHDRLVKVFPNVIETLTHLQNHGIKMGIVSTKMRQGVELGLNSMKIRSFFDSIISYDDVTHAKPHPEPVLKAMGQLDGQPKHTLMVGDSYQDIESGKNAGMRTAAVAWSHKGKDFLNQYHPTYMLHDMKDLWAILEV